MTKIIISKLGDAQVLEYCEADPPTAARDELLVKVLAAGVNYIDTYHRSGLYPLELPFTPGLEGTGVIESIGDDVNGFAVGDLVGWTNQIGSYSRFLALPASKAVPIPNGIEPEVAAASLLQGLTAHYLADTTYPLKAGDKCLVHAGAGGVGLALIQIAKMRRAEVFTTVGSAEKAEHAKAAGADHVIEYNQCDFAQAIEEIAGPKAINVVYDGVGAATFEQGLQVLAPLGMMVTFGNASGPVDPVSPLLLSQNGSLFLTRPTLFDYISTRSELERRCAELFSWIGSGDLEITIGARYSLAEAAEAHRFLESRRSIGKIILTP